MFFRSRRNESIAETAAAIMESPASLQPSQPPAPAVSDRERELEHAIATLHAYLTDGQGDLTRTLAIGSKDPALLHLEDQLNQVFGRVRTMRLQLEELTAQTSTAAASSGLKMQQTARQMDEARQELDAAASGVGQSQAGVSDVARAASSAATLATRAQEATTAGAAVIQGAIDSVSGIAQGIALAETRVSALIDHSEQIRKVSGVIDSIAQRTNLLALNAAIEAARAGVHGRGFSVVADEVRKLAEGTAAQTKEIGNLITAVAGDLAETGRVIRDGKGRADDGVALASKAGQALDRIQDLVKRTTEPLTEIAALAEEQSAALEQVTTSLHEVSQRVTAATESTTAVAEVTSGLTGMTEVAFSALNQFRGGSMVDGIADAARRVAVDVRRYLETAVDTGRFRLDDLLSFQYHEYKGQVVDRLKNLWGDVSRAPRDGFPSPKYGTAYDFLVDVDLMKMLDHHLESSPNVGFMVLQDVNGYSPAQNSRYCKAWTGDRETDFHSRVKRMNCDAAQVRASRMGLNWVDKEPLDTGVADVRNMRTVHTRREFLAAGVNLTEPAGGDDSILVQTFARHTGTIVNVLSIPLYVKGQRYGAIIVGWLPQRDKK